MSREVDTEDDRERDAAEAAIAAALTRAVLDHGQSGHPVASPSVGWRSVLELAVLPILLRYLRGTVTAMTVESGVGRSKQVTPRQVDQAARAGGDEAVAILSRWADETATPFASPPSPRPGRVAPPADTEPEASVSPPSPGEVARRVRVEAEGVSRSAVTAAREQARAEIAPALGATMKVWRTRHDSRVRPSHGELEGTAVPIGESFSTITGTSLQFPGDPRAPLGETAGCRCRLAYRLGAGQARVGSGIIGRAG